VPGLLARVRRRPGRRPAHPQASPAWLYRFCANAAYDACIWPVPIHFPETHCRPRRHNRVIPDLTGPGNILAWQKLATTKHRLVKRSQIYLYGADEDQKE
jgi:hypothetical protein